MDGSAVSAGPWLVLGAVVGLLLALVLALALAPGRDRRRPAAAESPEPAAAVGWVVDDLPAWLEDPAGAPDDGRGAPAPLLTPSTPLPTARPGGERTDAGRTVLAMALGALLLVGASAAVAALASHDRTGTPAARAPAESRTSERPPPVPDLPAVPEAPEPGDPGAGRLADRSVPVGTDGALAELAFEGIVLERRAVGVTAAFPTLTLTAAEVPGGPAVAHVELPTFNCLADSAPADPVAAGCLRTPVEYADLPTPALTVARAGDGLEISGRFPTYLRPSGSAPEWTGRVYPLTVTVGADGTDSGAEGVLQLGSERADVRDAPGLTVLRVHG